jgi:hypothetical protein
LDPSPEEYAQLVKEGGAGVNYNSSKAPSHLKCPLSSNLLVDAVVLPCCLKVPPQFTEKYTYSTAYLPLPFICCEWEASNAAHIIVFSSLAYLTERFGVRESIGSWAQWYFSSIY